MDKGSIKIAVGLSGGVDSSVAACLLKEQGYNVVGLTMKIWDNSFEIEQDGKHACYGPGEEDDIETARELCKKLDIPFYVIDLTKEYKQFIIEYFRTEYKSGRTPNPCVKCNHMMKFGFMLDKAKELGIDFDLFATGHYARIKNLDGRLYLQKSHDKLKDQTYFLHALSEEKLRDTVFPLGDLTKTEVRNIARRYKLEVAENPESQDFIDGGNYSVLFSEDEQKSGEIVNGEGEKLGTHRGIVHYTVGQRRGMGISSAKPLYITKIDVKNNRIIAGSKEELYSKSLIVSNYTLKNKDLVDSTERIKVRIRQKHREALAVLHSYESEKIKVIFDDPQLSISPGQSVVFYQNDIVLGGGVIENAL